MTAALVVFLLTYLIITGQKIPLLRLDRPSGALLGAVGMVVTGVVTPGEAGRDAVNHDTIALLLGMMIISAYMIEARIFRFTSWFTLTHVATPRRLLVALVFVSGLLSAVLVNDTICLMFTPLVVEMTRDARLRPLPFLLALCFGANAGSVATPTGNPQNMIIGTLSGIPYARFTALLALPAFLSLVAVAVILLILFRHDLPARPLGALHLPRPALQPRLALLCIIVLAAVMIAFVRGYPMAWTAMAGAATLVLLGRRTPRRVLGSVDWILLLFFTGLFIVSYGVGKSGVAARLFAAVEPLLGQGALRQSVVFGAFTVLASQIVSNVPFVLLASQFMGHFAEPAFIWLSTALFSTLAGNLTTVGSVANLIVLEGARDVEHVRFGQFLRYGALVTAATLAVGFAALWGERALGLLPR
jgi:Na+/H+ antiporter NhaD/arsenite permease-like protein